MTDASFAFSSRFHKSVDKRAPSSWQMNSFPTYCIDRSWLLARNTNFSAITTLHVPQVQPLVLHILALDCTPWFVRVCEKGDKVQRSVRLRAFFRRMRSVPALFWSGWEWSQRKKLTCLWLRMFLIFFLCFIY